MRRAAKTDNNQAELVKGLRKIGAKVFPTHTVGKGFPDLVVAFGGHNWLVEVKDPEKPPSGRKLTKDEATFFDLWTAPVFVIHTVEEFLDKTNEHLKRIGH